MGGGSGSGRTGDGGERGKGNDGQQRATNTALFAKIRVKGHVHAEQPVLDDTHLPSTFVNDFMTTSRKFAKTQNQTHSYHHHHNLT